MAEAGSVGADLGGGDTGGDSGGSETLSTEQAAQELDSWANEKPKARERSEDGKFAGKGKPSALTPDKEVARVLKGTMKQAIRPQPQEEEQEEEQPEEEKPLPKNRAGHKVKGIVNGREEEIDLDDEEFQKVNAVQASRAAQKAWREASEMRKEANQLKQALQDARAQVSKDPMALFRALGISDDEVYGFAQNKTIEKLSETLDPNTGQPYTPEQQRIIQLQKQLQQKEAVEQQQRMTVEQQEMEQIKDTVRQDIDRKFTAALTETGLPPTPYTMMRLADLMQSMGPDVDPQTVAPLVLEDMVNEVRTTIYSMPMEVAAEILGEEWMNDLRKWDMGKARATKDKFGRNPTKFPNNSGQRTPARGQKGNITQSTQDAAEWLEKWAEGR